jgi:hypothetical protein
LESDKVGGRTLSTVRRAGTVHASTTSVHELSALDGVKCTVGVSSRSVWVDALCSPPPQAGSGNRCSKNNNRFEWIAGLADAKKQHWGTAMQVQYVAQHTEHVTCLLWVDFDNHAHLDQIDDLVQSQPDRLESQCPEREGADEIVPSHVKFPRFHFSRTHDDAAPKGREMKSATVKGEDGQHGARGNAVLCREGFTDPPGLAIVGWRLNGCGKQTKGRSLRGWRGGQLPLYC